MDKLTHYRDCIKTLLKEQIYHQSPTDDIESQLIFDSKGDHYLWVNVGWNDLDYIYACFVHLDIKEGKIWIQRNGTELDIAHALVEMGVPQSDIILGLHPPYKRPYTGYGTPESIPETVSI
jgi:hypothetical protein